MLPAQSDPSNFFTRELSPLLSASRPAEKQNIAVRIGQFESPQAILGVLQRCAENRAAIGEFGGYSIRIWRKHERIPSHGWMTPGIWQRCHLVIRLEENLRSIAADDGEKWVLIRLLKCDLESKLVAIERNGSIDAADDENGEIAVIVGRAIKVLFFLPGGQSAGPAKRIRLPSGSFTMNLRSPRLLPQYRVESGFSTLHCQLELSKG